MKTETQKENPLTPKEPRNAIIVALDIIDRLGQQVRVLTGERDAAYAELRRVQPYLVYPDPISALAGMEVWNKVLPSKL